MLIMDEWVSNYSKKNWRLDIDRLLSLLINELNLKSVKKDKNLLNLFVDVLLKSSLLLNLII